ncbi:aldehyde dehydrogenase family protein [Rhodococcus opacus]|uniref:aldehyde dehydrogenase family protein n=1 Tax=Rhodococcus opacus TaxID=37919 RepID=UPI00352F7999
MEFGGNAPFLVFEDADVDAAVEGAAPARFVTAVRRVSRRTDFCCPTRSLRVHGQTGARRRVAGQSRVGTGADIGPLVSARQVDAVRVLVDDAIARGPQ